ECCDWIREKVEIRSLVEPDFLHGKMYHVKNLNDTESALIGSSNFTVQGLGLGAKPNMELNLIMNDTRDIHDLKVWFDELWNNDTGLVEDVKDKVLKYLDQLYAENDPEFIYFKTLYHIFEKYLNEQAKGGLLTEVSGFYDSEIWQTLYSFQKDGVKGAINKILKHGGCIIADSVGLGKTFEALAIIKYFESLNSNTLVICPKKLSDNWTIYQASKNHTLNPFAKDRFRFNVLYHTDLNRITGNSDADGVDLSSFNWGAFDLVVIDESHNFRNNIKGKENEHGEKMISRYERLMEDIIKKGGKTKVLMLSATPVNNSLRDLRNQIYFITEGSDTALAESTGIKNIENTIKNAQTQFTLWADPKKNPNRSVKELLERLDSSFTKLLDELTIARSRKHIVKYYDISEIGKFPDRLKVISVYPDIDLNKRFPSYDKLNREIMKYKLSLFNPSFYVREEFKTHYENLAGVKIKNFSQEKREHFLIGMMKVNFLKRLESSIESFEISMDRTIKKIETLVEKIIAFKSSEEENLEMDPSTLMIRDEEDEELIEANENLSVGKKFRFQLKHLKLDEWLADLQTDKDQLIDLLNNAATVTPDRDAKMDELKKLIRNKIEFPLNEGNKKVIIFTAFADTAWYLYHNLESWAKNELNIDIAMVTGGVMENKTTFKQRGKGLRNQSDYASILTNFSPGSKKRQLMHDMPQEGGIDLLIATDCISEGQNLQDCDFLINYDIHWNPVRIIQRFGRIDRIGSKNNQIQLVNFWPTKDLDNYINLKERVEARMALVDLTATQEENILDNQQLEDLIAEDMKFRNKQLKTLQSEVIDLEELDENINLSEFTLDDFRIELMNFFDKNKEKLVNAELGLYAVAPSPSGSHAGLVDYSKLQPSEKEIIKPGVIFCVRQKGDTSGNEEVNPLQPYFLVYIRNDGTVRFNYVHAKQILDIFRMLCSGKDKPFEQLCDIFNEETRQGAEMETYTNLLKKSIDAIKTVFRSKSYQKLTGDRGAVLIPQSKSVSGNEQFELITWLVIK
ncbi:MAG: helicase-related protein, partial [Bacteroidota bacterium]